MVIPIEDIARRSAAGIGLAFRSGEADPVELADYLLGRIGAAPDASIFLAITPERARREAAASAERYRRGAPLSALDGVPITWKDLFDVAGTPTTAGSDLLRNSPPKEADAEVVGHAAAAGMVCLGKVNLTEFAYSGLGHNPHYGTPDNPNDRKVKRSPGGSSSASGVVVAAGLSPVSIGTDTGGSVRVPSSLNGTYGYKSSERRISKIGMYPLSPTLDTVGPLARSIEDCVLMDMILRGVPTTNVRRRQLAGLTVVIPQNVVLDDLDAAVAESFERSIAIIEREGAKIVRRHVAPISDVLEEMAQHGTLTSAESYFAFRKILETPDGERIDGRVVHRIMQGADMSAYDLQAVQHGRARAQAQLAQEMGDNAVLAFPTTPVTAPEFAPLEADTALFHKVNLKVLRNTAPGNILAMCGVAIPNGRDDNGLPTSILFSAPSGRDEEILGLGLEFDRVLRGLFEPTWMSA